MILKLAEKATIKVIKEVAGFIRDEARDFNKKKVEHKGFNDLVSYVDKQAEKLLVEGLTEVMPDAGFITEEGTSSKEGEEYNWIIDPLDGTTNFVHGIPTYSVSVALQKNDEIILGIVYEINHDECFHAVAGGPAYVNEQKIEVSQDVNLSASLIATGFPYNNFDKVDGYLAILKNIMQKSHGLRRIGSAAVDLAYVACGRFEGFFEYNLNAWDVAAGAFIVQQAGGTVSTFNNEKNYIFGREILAAAPKVHAELLEAISKNWKSE
ncbi:inositol monophosphatase family protein [Marivirga atlantica]|jgi:myo-inositol-1(or 4)-monophosphatase|uniref:Inositol-1-monophosphatase n=1 Tax=Marivirga atlantica TaxID=1548457 RepID=A0A937ACC9_9BACT|nr:inositol monophosphatase family protein [Marivirga atlantica]MBL0763964.1 inositol monophosphatase [Marivirga atlantica]